LIAINIIVSKQESDSIKNKESDTFKIISALQTRSGNSHLFVVEAEEEEVTFLKLKYGDRNVWKR